MKKQRLGGIALIIFGFIVLLLSIFTSNFITKLKGYLWRISLNIMGILFIIFGIMNLLHKED